MQEKELVKSVTLSDSEEKATDLFFPQMDFAALERADKGANISPKYLEFDEPGLVLRAFFQGVTYVEKVENGKNKRIKVVLLISKDGAYINGNIILVDYLTKFASIGSAVEISYLGEKKTSTGNKVKDFNVSLLLL